MGVLLALDPGVTTGAAWLTEEGEVVQQQWKTTHQPFWNVLASLMPEAIVYERFLYQRRDKVVLYPVEVIGVIKLYCEGHNIPWFEQTPHQGKNLWTDSKLKKLGLWLPASPHAMDATRHLLYHLVVTKGDKSWLEPLRPNTQT